MIAARLIALEAVAGVAACLLFWAEPWCAASFVALAVSAVCAVGSICYNN